MWDLLAHEYRQLKEPALEWRLANPFFESTREGWQRYVADNGWRQFNSEMLYECRAFRVWFS